MSIVQLPSNNSFYSWHRGKLQAYYHWQTEVWRYKRPAMSFSRSSIPCTVCWISLQYRKECYSSKAVLHRLGKVLNVLTHNFRCSQKLRSTYHIKMQKRKQNKKKKNHICNEVPYQDSNKEIKWAAVNTRDPKPCHSLNVLALLSTIHYH